LVTPSLYIIDDQKKIIAKKVPADKVEDFLIQYEKFQKTKAADKSSAPTKTQTPGKL
jgi:hypothetical protein